MNAVRSGWRRKKGILALMLVLSIIFGLFIPVSAENDNDEQEEVPADGGFSVSLSWTGGDVDPVEYNYDSVSSETRLVRLKVSYHNDKLLADYAKGRIVISVPGINDVLRRGEAKPVAIAADKADDTYKIYDWSYTYNSSSGIYTFTNNDSVTKDAVYDGMFEIVWSIPSASSLNGYSKTLQATLQTERGENTQSGEVTYSQTRKRDEYFLTPQSATYDPASRVYSSEGLAGLIMPGKTEDDYRFIRYSGFRYSKRSYSRSVTGDSGSTLKADFSVWVPTGVNICGSRGTENGPDQFTKTGNTKTIDGVLYNEWRISGATVTAYGTSGLMFFAAYPNETYLGQNVKVYLEAYGKYYDETERVKLAEQVYTANTGDYDYLENGTVYLAGLTVRGVRNSYADSHCSDCRSNGCINAEDIGIRQTVYSSDILFSCYENSGETFEIGLDRFQVKTADGNNRFLNDDEYHYKAIVLPSLSGRTNINEIVTHSETYDTEIYVRHAGAEAYELYSDEYKLDGSSHTVQFTDTDIAAVSVRIKSVDQSFQGLVFLSDYVFHSSQDDIQLDNGILRHYMFVRRFDSDGRLIPDTEDTVLLPGDEQYFSEPVYREYDDSHILIIPNILRTSASLSQESHTSTQYLFDASVTDIFDVPDGNNVTAFTVYTVIPDGIHIQELYSTEAEFADHISLTGLFLEEGVLKEHMTLRILERTNTAGRVRKYLEMKFDFSDAPIINNGSSSRKYTLKIKNIPLAVNIDEINQRQEGGLDPKTFNYWLYTMTTIDQEGFWYADHTDSLTYEDGMWRDIDGDGDTAEKIAFSSAITGFTVAGFAQLESVISVRTGLSNGFVRPDYDSLAQTFSNVPEVYGAHPYTYRIKFRGNQDQVGSIVIVDSIESDAASEWQGTLLGVDTSNITAFTGVEPVVYWSRSEEDDSVRPDLSDTSKWSVLPADISGWTEEQRAAVRTIAVDLGEATLTRGQYILLDLLLDSPDNSCGDHNYQMTVNKCGVHFRTIDEQTGLELEDICQRSAKVAVQIDPYMGTVKIQKKDHDDASPLSGVRFNLYNKSDGSFYSGGIVTDSSGQAVVRNVPYGRYYLKELQSKKGYYLLSEPIDVELSGSIPGITVNVDIDNIRRPTSVKLTKTSDRDNSPLPGAVFRLHKADGSYQNDTLYTTDADGMLYVTDVPWGSYYLEETEPPAGYEITDEAENIPFTVKAENNAGAELSLKVKNRQLPGQVRMYKYERLENGDATTTPVGGAFYELYDSGDELLGTYMTDNNGLLYVEDLDFGSYYFIESVPATGYGLNGDRIDFTVDGEDLQADGTVVQELTTYDQRLTGSFFIQKRDDREELVKGAAYGLFRQSDDVRVDAQGNEITNTMSDYGLFVTDDAGSVTVRNVYWGDYYLMEVEAPTGYALNTTKYPVSVNRNTVYNVIRINATDERLKGSVLLIKADKDDLTRRLPGAVYSLYKSSGSLVRSGITTGDDGTVLINDIPWGTYYLEEEVPPPRASDFPMKRCALR